MSDAFLFSELRNTINEMALIVDTIHYKVTYLADEKTSVYISAEKECMDELHSKALNILNQVEYFQNLDDDD